MSYTVRTKVGDTARQLSQTLTLFGRPIDLTDAIVYFIARHTTDPSVYIEREAVVVDALKGKVRFKLNDQEASVAGLYNYEWRIIFVDGSPLTVPDDSSETLEIVKGVRRIGNV